MTQKSNGSVLVFDVFSTGQLLNYDRKLLFCYEHLLSDGAWNLDFCTDGNVSLSSFVLDITASKEKIIIARFSRASLDTHIVVSI